MFLINFMKGIKGHSFWIYKGIAMQAFTICFNPSVESYPEELWLFLMIINFLLIFWFLKTLNWF